MREKQIITMNGKPSEFIELIYYDGSKLQIDLNNNRILAWYDYFNDYEEWFLINLEKDLFLNYLSNEISLFDIMQKGKVNSVKRYYSEYNTLNDMRHIELFDRYELPDNDALLGFDFTREKDYLSHLVKNHNTYNKSYVRYEKKVTHYTHVNKISYSKQTYSTYDVNTSNWESNNAVAA